MNKFADDFDFYRSCVDQDERVLWKGKPGKGRTLGSNGERFIVFGRFWLRSGLIEDGTAIGNGLATAINRLRESDAKSKVIILLTDGVNNRGEIAPQTAAEIAKAQGIRVYTIGVGTEGMAPYPAIDMFGNLTFVNQKVEIDEKVLKAISDMTGGRYFRATDKEKLKAVYDEINQLEKSKIEVMEHISYHELFLTWALAALGLLFAEFLLSNLVLKRIP